MSTPIIDERLLYPDSIPEIAENFNRVMEAIDSGGGSSDYHFVRFIPVLPEGFVLEDPAPVQVVYHGDNLIQNFYAAINEEENYAYFKKAYTDAEMTEEWDEGPVTENLTLYLEYEEKISVTFIISYNDGSEEVTSNCIFEKFAGEYVTASELASVKAWADIPEGYTFDHFAMDGATITDEAILAIAVVEYIEITAYFEEGE